MTGVAGDLKRVSLFAFLCLLLSLFVLALDFFGVLGLMSASMVTVYGIEVVVCGVLGIAMRAWRTDSSIAVNLLAALSCFVIPAVSIYGFLIYLGSVLHVGWVPG